MSDDNEHRQRLSRIESTVPKDLFASFFNRLSAVTATGAKLVFFFQKLKRQTVTRLSPPVIPGDREAMGPESITTNGHVDTTRQYAGHALRLVAKDFGRALRASRNDESMEHLEESHRGFAGDDMGFEGHGLRAHGLRGLSRFHS